MQIHPTSNTKCIVVVIHFYQHSRRPSQQHNSPMSETHYNMVTTEVRSHLIKYPLSNSPSRVSSCTIHEQRRLILWYKGTYRQEFGVLAYRVLKTVTNKTKHLALFSLLSHCEIGILTALLKHSTESNDPSTEIVPWEENLATREYHTHLREGTWGNILLCKHWFATSSLKGKCDFSKMFSFIPRSSLVVYCGSNFIILFLVG